MSLRTVRHLSIINVLAASALAQSNPPATFGAECSECPPPVVFADDMPGVIDPLGSLPPCMTPIADGCLTDPVSPPLGGPLPDPPGIPWVCLEYHLEPNGDTYGPPTVSHNCMPSDPNNKVYPVPFVDADGDGIPHLLDPDEPNDPFPPGPLEQFNDDNGNGIPNVYDLWETRPVYDSRTGDLIKGGTLKNGVLPPQYENDSAGFEQILSAAGVLDVDAVGSLFPPKFDDINGDGHVTLDEAAQGLVDSLRTEVQDMQSDSASQPLSRAQAVAQLGNSLYVLGGALGLDGRTLGEFANIATAFGQLFNNATAIQASLGVLVGLNVVELSDFSVHFRLSEDGYLSVDVQMTDVDGNPIDYGDLLAALKRTSTRTDSQAADPVRTANGEFVYTATDIRIRGRGLHLNLERTYQSRSAAAGFLGKNWTTTLLDTHILVWPARSQGQILDVAWGSGQRSLFVETTSAHPNEQLFEGTSGEFGKIRTYRNEHAQEPTCPDAHPWQGYALRKPNGLTYYFCPPSWHVGSGSFLVCWLRKVSDQHGNAITLRRNDHGQVTEIIDSLGRSLVLSYDSDTELVESITDWDGRVTSYTYDPDKLDLIRVDYPVTRFLDDTDVVDEARPYEVYTYDEHPAGFLAVPEPHLNHNLTSISRGSSSPLVTLVYSQTAGYSFDKVVSQSVGGKTTTFSYAPITDPVEPKVTHETTITYDNGITERFLHGQGLLYRSEQVNGRLDAAGMLIPGTNDPMGPGAWWTCYSYNDDYLITSRLRTTDVAHPNGRLHEFFYDSTNGDRFQQNNLVEERATVGDPGAQVVLATTYTHDPVTGRVLSVTDPLGRTTARTYGHQELPYDQVRALPGVSGWSILPPVPDEPSLWGVGDVNSDGQLGGTFDLIRTKGPLVDYQPTSTSGLTSGRPTELFQYNEHGQVSSRRDAGGTWTTMTYDGGYEQTATLDPSGVNSWTRITVNSRGEPIVEESKDGRRVEYEYDSRGNLVQRRLRASGFNMAGAFASSSSSGSIDPTLPPDVLMDAITTRIFYDLAGNEVGSEGPFGGIGPQYAIGLRPELDWRAVNNSAGQEVAWNRMVWSAAGAISDEGTWQVSYDARGNWKRVTLPNLAALIASYDARGLQVELKTKVGAVTHSVTTKQFNEYGEETDIYGPEDSDGDGALDRVHITRDVYGLVESVLSPSGIERALERDLAGRVTGEEIRVGGTVLARTERDYDDLDRVLVRRRKNLHIHADGSVTSLPQVWSETRYGYGLEAGQLLWVLEDAGGAQPTLTRYSYDSAGRRVATYHGASNDVGVIEEIGQAGQVLTRTYRMDGEGRTGSTSPSEPMWRYFYDDYGYLSAVVDPSFGTTSITMSPEGRVRSERDALGSVRIFDYDSLGRLVRLQESGPGVPSNTVNYEYDIFDNVVLVRDGVGNETTYSYDRFANRVAKVFHDGGRVDYGYDRANRRTSVSTVGGPVLSYEYDGDDRVVRLVASGAQADVIRDIDYDGLGNRTNVAEAVGGSSTAITREYSSLGALLSESCALPGGNVTTHQLEWDGAGRVTKVTYDSGHTVSRSYDALGRLANITSSLFGNLWTSVAPYGLSLVREATGGGATLSRDFDGLGRTRSDRVVGSGGQVIVGSAYTYDVVGNLTEEERLVDGRRDTFEYDSLHRLTSWSRDGAAPRSVQWMHDEVDRVTARTESGSGSPVTVTPQYNSLNQLTAYGTAFPAVSYDATGEEQSRSGAGVSLTWQWDALGRPISVAKSDGSGTVQANFTFDGVDRLAKLVNDEGEYIYGYAGSNVLSVEHDVHGVTECVRDAAMDRLLWMRQGVEGWHVFSDRQGSVRATYSSGAVVEAYDYDPFGRVVDASTGMPVQSGAIGRNLLFLGGPRDNVSGCHILGRRLLDPLFERFVSRDPLEELPGPNLYEYARSNPWRWTDPSGLIPEETEGATSPHTPTGLMGEREAGTEYIASPTTFHFWTFMRAQDEYSEVFADDENVARFGNHSDFSVHDRARLAEYMAETNMALVLELSLEGKLGEARELLTGAVVARQAANAFGAIHSLSTIDGQVGLDGLALSEIPVVSQVAGLTSAAIDIKSGDYFSGALGIAGAIPLIGAAADGARAGRRIEKAVREAAKAAKRLDREIKTAKRALRRNKRFRRWFHREFKPDQKVAGGGRENPDLTGQQVLEAYQEWKQIGGS